MNQGELRQISCKDLLRFYFWWFTKEEKICIDFNNESKKSAALYQYLKYMKIARNFKKNNPDNIFLAASRIFKDNKNEDKGKIINLLSEEFNRLNLLSGNNKNAIVAASKILWLFDRETIIMDNLNKNILKRFGKIKNYEDYEKIWKNKYKENEKSINSIIKEYNMTKIDKVFNQKWFKMRVFDMFLWAYK
mgnify:CR=1 FL=1